MCLHAFSLESSFTECDTLQYNMEPPLQCALCSLLKASTGHNVAVWSKHAVYSMSAKHVTLNALTQDTAAAHPESLIAKGSVE